MSDAHNEHESVIKTPKQLIAAIAASFLIPIICIVLLVEYVSNNSKVGAGSDGQTDEAIAARIQPVADQGFILKDANAPKQLLAGADVYKASCAACHTAGVAGAPKVGDAGAWSARIAQGFDKLVANAVNGFQGKAGVMPAKGGNPDLDDIEVARAVAYMANESGAKFKEPEAKAPAVAAETTTRVEPQTAGAPVASATDPLAATTQVQKTLTPDAGKTASADTGKKLYESACAVCHAAGIAGAPKLGDKAAWADRIKQGNNLLYEHAIKGFQGKTGFMPPKGGSSAPDEEVKAAVDYMVGASK